ncbi:MAG TPA: DUF2917 domain-containing protein [Burkholderiales bacterium]|jgi:hypothetical protein|nr:DUF2917 domain-containing protein [Burkholderiales bacterium]
MKIDLDEITIQLTKGNLISLPDAEGSTVAVLWGSVWITQEGIWRDYELNDGESFTSRGDGKILISAFENSALTILQPCDNAAEPHGEKAKMGQRARSKQRRVGALQARLPRATRHLLRIVDLLAGRRA